VLANLGWNSFFADSLASFGANLEPARVIEVRRGSCIVAARDNAGGLAELVAQVSGRFSASCLSQADWPATGDWVGLRSSRAVGNGGSLDMLTDPTGVHGDSLELPIPTHGPTIIEAVLARKSVFARKAAGDPAYDKVREQVLVTNVDTAFIITAAGNDFSTRRIERYLALALDSGSTAVLVVSKADLATDSIGGLLDQVSAVCPFVPAIAVSALDGQGLDEFGQYLLPGSTAVLLGSSGSGKSTLLNALAGSSLARTNQVKAYDQHGRHTTTARTLFRLPGGAMIIDTPGLREVQLWLEGDSLDSVFAEVDAAARQCRFSDCSHNSEPGCAVQAGLADGTISAERYANWLRLQREVRYTRARTAAAARQAEKAKWKKISRFARDLDKARRRI
jgi:ribosome biogenesis GTPase